MASPAPQLLVGLAPTRGVYPPGATAVGGKRQWLTCTLAPGFVAEVDTPKAIVQSRCPLARANLPPGLYDLQVGVNYDSAVEPMASSLLGVVLIAPDGRFTNVNLSSPGGER
ncbi:MAG: hypothetical protein JW953_05135 [Anaerolineae bacterium]|nr:hypothetical protein [Anaerolineae bacterium]